VTRLCVWLGLVAALAGCSTGEGQGSVVSDDLYVKNCWHGPFDLRPSFFASDPFENTQQIRIQRGERMIGVSDGVSFVVNDVDTIRKTQLNQAIPLGLPIGVRPPGFPIRVEANPPQVSMTLYLNDTCHVQNGGLYSIDGTITFTSLFSGDRNENDSENRLTEATFTATVADPRDADFVQAADGGAVTVEPVADDTSVVTGTFRFFFQRGSPAQPFP
jgi:hypothetical protein